MATPRRIILEDEDGVPVVRFLDRNLLDETIVRAIHEQIDASLRPGEPIGLILDFSNVSMVSSAFIGRIVVLHNRAGASKGLLVMCELGPAVRDTFRTTNLDRVLKIGRDRREAREAFGPKR
jgi:anti-sigma B factor antagonist